MNYTKAKIFNMVLKNLRVSVSIQNVNQNDKNTVILNEFLIFERFYNYYVFDTPPSEDR